MQLMNIEIMVWFIEIMAVKFGLFQIYIFKIYQYQYLYTQNL